MTEKIVLNRVNSIKKGLDEIRDHLLDVTLTNNDISALEKADKDLEEGKTMRL